MATHWTKEVRRVIGFLSAKGLLFAEGVVPNASVKLDLVEVLRIGLETDARIIEVLPAAIIHFPKSFLNLGCMPEKLKEVIDRIENDSATGPDLAGIPYHEMRRWAHFRFKDRRAKPLGERKVMKSFRLRPETWRRLKREANSEGVTETALLERLIEGVSPGYSGRENKCPES